jgi:heat shock protein HtpX
MTDWFAQQRRQRVRTVVLLVLLVVFVIATGYALTVPFQWVMRSCEYPLPTPGTFDVEEVCEPVPRPHWGALIGSAAVVTVVLSIGVLRSRRGSLAITGLRAPDARLPWERRFPSIVEQMAIAAGLRRVPHVAVLEDPTPNAFATWTRGAPVVIVTSGLLADLDDRQLTGVVAHEVAHLRNRDARVIWTATYAVGLVASVGLVLGVIAVATASPSEVARREGRDDSQPVVAFAAGLLAAALLIVPLPVVLLVRALLSRRRELLADAAAVQYTRDPGGLRGALEIVQRYTALPIGVTGSNSRLWIRDPGVHGLFGSIFDSHPPIERRIAWLRSLEGAAAAGPVAP